MITVGTERICIKIDNKLITINVISKSANVDIEIREDSVVSLTDTIYVENDSIIGRLSDYLS